MSLGIYPVFNPDLPAARLALHGHAMAAEFEALDRIAGVLGLPAFTSFSDSRPVPDDFDGSPDDFQVMMGPCDDWFPAEDGLRTVTGLLDAVEDGGEWADEISEPERMTAELRALAECLRTAARHGAEFRLTIG